MSFLHEAESKGSLQEAVSDLPLEVKDQQKIFRPKAKAKPLVRSLQYKARASSGSSGASVADGLPTMVAGTVADSSKKKPYMMKSGMKRLKALIWGISRIWDLVTARQFWKQGVPQKPHRLQRPQPERKAHFIALRNNAVVYNHGDPNFVADARDWGKKPSIYANFGWSYIMMLWCVL